MADALLSLVTGLLEQLGSFAAQQALEELQLLVGVDDELQNLQDNFKMVQAMLNKFEERRLRDDAVKLWYDKLEDAYYMMDDILDKWNTARIKSEIQKEEERAVTNNNPAALETKVPCSFFLSLACCFVQVDNLPLRHEVGRKIKKLNETLANILKGKQEFGIDLKSQPERDESLQTTSIVDVSKIVGRNEYRDDPLNSLLGVDSQEESNPLVITLVGVGGIGKSTLAKLAYNHSKVNDHFQKIMWVCVSDPFNECKVAKAIIQELDPKHESLNNTTNTLQALLRIVCDLIKDKKFFLVFDDVWAKDFSKESKKWEPFKDALICGAQGSRILVTTQNEKVAHMMGSTKTHIINLGNLSVDDCWLIIRKIAFINENIDQHKDLEPLGRKLANKCHGLPLAAKLIGGYMCNKRRKEQWEKVLDNSLWDLEDVERGLLGPLLLSYYELSLAEKKCFLFCAVFPKDHEINRFELIIHWMAQGYIDIDSKRNMEMEDMAEEYFQKLVMRSFFQDFEKDEIDGRIKSCKMHDIVHDFAQTMTKDVCFTIEGDEEVKIDFKRARLLSLIVKETFPESVYEAKNLRFLNLDFMSSQILQPKLFDNLTCLRMPHLEGQSILGLSNEVEKLIHLRYLKLSCFEIKELPESICNLCNLQSLDVSECRKLEKLPEGIGKLINLRHLLFEVFEVDVDEIKIKIKSFPKGIGRLTCLKTLRGFAVGGKGEEICKLGELEHLNHIQGTFKIYGLRNVVDFGAIENTLKKKKDLRDLGLSFNTLEEEEEEETEEERRRKMEKDVAILNALEPPPRLESLYIQFFEGTTMYPNWMMSKLTYLKNLTLKFCPNLEQLPPLGKLPLLEMLYIVDAPMIRKVGDEFLGIDIEEEELSESSKNNNNKDIIVFPNLKSLHYFEYLWEWEEWTGMGGTIEEEEEEEDNSANAFVTNNTPKIKIMPRLHSLKIEWCGNLKSLPDYLRNTPLKRLEINKCRILEQRCERGIGDYWPYISYIPNIKIDDKYVQRDGQLPDSIHSETETNEQVEANIDSDDDLESIPAHGGGADSESDEEAPEAANAEDSDEEDSSIRTFTTARPDAANAGGGSGSAQDGESELLRHG